MNKLFCKKNFPTPFFTLIADRIQSQTKISEKSNNSLIRSNQCLAISTHFSYLFPHKTYFLKPHLNHSGQRWVTLASHPINSVGTVTFINIFLCWPNKTCVVWIDASFMSTESH